MPAGVALPLSAGMMAQAGAAALLLSTGPCPRHPSSAASEQQLEVRQTFCDGCRQGKCRESLARSGFVLRFSSRREANTLSVQLLSFIVIMSTPFRMRQELCYAHRD